MTPQQAALVLELALPTDQGAVKRAFREKARTRHPDHGGTNEAFREVKEARDVLLRDPKPAPVSSPWQQQQSAYPGGCGLCGGSVFGHTFSCPFSQQQAYAQQYAAAEAAWRQQAQQAMWEQIRTHQAWGDALRSQQSAEQRWEAAAREAQQARDEKLRDDLRTMNEQAAAKPEPKASGWRRWLRPNWKG